MANEYPRVYHGYLLHMVVGSGTYGEVCKATKIRELSHAPWVEFSQAPYFAVKRQIVKEDASKPAKKETEDTSFSVSLLREVKILRELKHPNVINMCDLIVDTKNHELGLVFEYAEYDMMKIVDHYKKDIRESLPEYTVKSFLWQSLKGLQYLHENWIMHRDLKPENILIIGDPHSPRRGSVVLADLGLARIFRNPVQELGIVDKVVVTLWYRAPELLLGKIDYTPAVDMWSAGCIFAALLLAKESNTKALFQGTQLDKDDHAPTAGESKRPPFQAEQCDKIFKILGLPKPSNWSEVDKLPEYSKIKQERPYPAESALRKRFRELSDNGFDLLARMLTMDPAKRITAAEALSHPYFKQNPIPGDNALDVPVGTSGIGPVLKLPPVGPAVMPVQSHAYMREIDKRKREIEEACISGKRQKASEPVNVHKTL